MIIGKDELLLRAIFTAILAVVMFILSIVFGLQWGLGVFYSILLGLFFVIVFGLISLLNYHFYKRMQDEEDEKDEQIRKLEEENEALKKNLNH